MAKTTKAPADPDCQHFTPYWLARIVAQIVAAGPHARILEPSAGDGALARHLVALPGCEQITCVERDRELYGPLGAALSASWRPGPDGAYEMWRSPQVHRRDFLLWGEEQIEEHAGRLPLFDVAATNPPYDDGLDTEHLVMATRLCRRVVAVLRLAALSGQDRHRLLWRNVRMLGVWVCVDRPNFPAPDGSLIGDGPRHDFVVVEYASAGEVDPVSTPTWRWIREPGK